MGKWLAEALALDENFSNMAQRATDKTDERPIRGVVSVLSVPQLGKSENFSTGGGNPETSFVGFVSADARLREGKNRPDGRALVRAALADFDRRLDEYLGASQEDLEEAVTDGN